MVATYSRTSLPYLPLRDHALVSSHYPLIPYLWIVLLASPSPNFNCDLTFVAFITHTLKQIIYWIITTTLIECQRLIPPSAATCLQNPAIRECEMLWTISALFICLCLHSSFRTANGKRLLEASYSQMLCSYILLALFVFLVSDDKMGWAAS